MVMVVILIIMSIKKMIKIMRLMLLIITWIIIIIIPTMILITTKMVISLLSLLLTVILIMMMTMKMKITLTARATIIPLIPATNCYCDPHEKKNHSPSKPESQRKHPTLHREHLSHKPWKAVISLVGSNSVRCKWYPSYKIYVRVPTSGRSWSFFFPKWNSSEPSDMILSLKHFANASPIHHNDEKWLRPLMKCLSHRLEEFRRG